MDAAEHVNGPRFLAVNVRDEDEAFVLTALIPGVKADDLNILVLEDVVRIPGIDLVGPFQTGFPHAGRWLKKNRVSGSWRRFNLAVFPIAPTRPTSKGNFAGFKPRQRSPAAPSRPRPERPCQTRGKQQLTSATANGSVSVLANSLSHPRASSGGLPSPIRRHRLARRRSVFKRVG